jgi:hypothetical protein
MLGESSRLEGLMARQPLSVPVSLMLVIAGIAIIHYVFHSHGWIWNGGNAARDIWQHLPVMSRAAVVGGLILNAWGVGGLVNGLVAKKP